MALAWHDGKFLDKNSITISVADFGFSRGVAVFEFARVYDGVPFRLDDHLERFEHGAKVFGINFRWKREEIIAVVKRLITENKYPHSTIKFYVTAGECGQPGSGGFATCADFTPHLMIIEDEAKPLHLEAPKGLEMYQRGISLKLVSFARQTPEVKSINYVPGFIASRQWGAEGYDDILFSHNDGAITETPTANFFAVIDGVLCTADRGMLHGVTRKVILELAAKVKVSVAVRRIETDELSGSTEAFISGSFAEMLPVRKIDHHALTHTTDGPVYRQLRQAFTDYVKAYVVKASA